jgi:molecular chaperone GrpE
MVEARREVDQEPDSAQAEAARLLDSLQRERAAFLNYKHRVEQDRAEDRVRAQTDVLLRLLPLLDELEQALSQAPADIESHPWVEGVALSRNRLLGALREMGTERFGAAGELFDPLLHEALFYEPRAGVSERQVDAVLRPGYRMGDRLLRPAQVSVIGPSDESQTPEPGAGNENAGQQEETEWQG